MAVTSKDGLGTSNATTDPYSLAYGELVFGSVVLIIIVIVGIIGNSMIICSVILSKKLRTSTNAFVVSLSVADLLTCLFLPWQIVALLGRDGWALPGAEWLCGATAFVVFSCTGISIYNLAAIAINRLVYLTRPFMYHTVYKPWKVSLMVSLIWLTPVSILAALILAGIGNFGYETDDYPSCSDLDDVPGADAFNLAQTIVAFPLPFVIIIICYTWIYIHIRRHYKRKREREMELTEYANNFGSEVNRSQETLNEMHDQELEITKYLFAVVCAFFVCFAPLFVGNAIPNSGHFNFYTSLLTSANSAVNFFIYASRHPQFKVVLRCMLRCRLADIPQPSNILHALTTVSNVTVTEA